MRVYTTKTPKEGLHFKLAPYVTTEMPSRKNWSGYALERFSDGTVLVVWTEPVLDVIPSQFINEKVAFDDLIWLEGFPADESPEVIRCVFTEADAADIGIDIGVKPEVALERAREWGKHIGNTVTEIAAEQLSSAIYSGEV